MGRVFILGVDIHDKIHDIVNEHIGPVRHIKWHKRVYGRLRYDIEANVYEFKKDVPDVITINAHKKLFVMRFRICSEIHDFLKYMRRGCVDEAAQVIQSSSEDLLFEIIRLYGIEELRMLFKYYGHSYIDIHSNESWAFRFACMMGKLDIAMYLYRLYSRYDLNEDKMGLFKRLEYLGMNDTIDCLRHF
jgi:hypothetical protein